MQPSKKIKTEVSQIKPLIADKPLKSKKNQEVDSDNEEQTTQQPQVSEEVKVSQLARNREIEKDVYGFDVKKSQNWINKQRTLVFCSRGISVQGRFLMLDLINLLPHCKKENKIEKVEIKEQVNELCTLTSCNNVLYFECRKKRDLYLWMSKFPNGPSTKFHVENIHTTEELRMTGNCIKGSRPLLSFDGVFDENPHYKVLKEILIQTFGTPNMHPKQKPFYDHVFAFNVADNRIWFRNYQIVYADEDKELGQTELIEIGPRFVLNPIKTFEGCMAGTILYSNEFYVSPNKARRDLKLKRALERANKVGKKRSKKEEQRNISLPADEVDGIFEGEDYEDGADLDGSFDDDYDE